MTQDEAFLQAIIESPNDDSPRLIYADWLDEHGQPDRAEFIRIQCELEKVPPGHLAPPVLDRRERNRDTVRSAPRAKLRRREKALLRKHGKKWAGPLGRVVHRWEFHRGFVEAAELGAGPFLGHAGELFRLAPIRHVWLTGADDHLDALLRTPPPPASDGAGLVLELLLQRKRDAVGGPAHLPAFEAAADPPAGEDARRRHPR